MGKEEARAALDRAKRHLERVQAAWWESAAPEAAVTFAFYAYENAVVAAAEAKGIRWARNHVKKANLAGKLHHDGLVSVNLEAKLLELNELREDVACGEPGYALEQVDLEQLATELEEFIEEAERVVAADEKSR